MAGIATISSTLLLHKSVHLPSQSSRRVFVSSFLFNREKVSIVPLVVCYAKKKLSFMDEILDYIEGKYSQGILNFSFKTIFHFYTYPLIHCSFLGGPKLRKWYGARDLLSKDGAATEDEEDYSGR